MAFGEILRNARVQKGLTPSEVAESTHMLVQVVESLEQEDFRRIAAPIYGRGFVKLYAEIVGLDPDPLVCDFMDLYNGARVPAVLTKKVDPPSEPAPLSVPTPVTRTVSGPAPFAPHRQPMQPRPAVRPAVRPVTATVLDEDEGAFAALPDDRSEPEVEEALETVVEPPRTRIARPSEAAYLTPTEPEVKKDFRPAFVVEPEEPYADMDSFDLFRSAPQPIPPAAEDMAPIDDDRPDKPVQPAVRTGLPIFQIGGRMGKKEEPVVISAEAHALRHARVQTFMDGFAKLRDGVERRLPVSIEPRQIWLVGGLGVVMAVLMAVGISVLFKLTGSVKVNPTAHHERIMPPPPLYVD